MEAGLVDGQSGIGQVRPAAADAGGPFQQGLEARGQGIVAAVDGVLDVAQHVGVLRPGFETTGCAYSGGQG